MGSTGQHFAKELSVTELTNIPVINNKIIFESQADFQALSSNRFQTNKLECFGANNGAMFL